jgi:hypothetical protein
MNMQKLWKAINVFCWAYLCLTFLFVMSVLLANIAYAECYTGSFYDPDKKGEGFNLESLPNSAGLVAYFYTYKFEEEEFFVMLGDDTEEESVFKMKVYDTRMNSSDPYSVSEWDVGWATFIFSGRDSFEYTVNLQLDMDGYDGDGIPWCIGYGSIGGCNWEGQVQRLTDGCQ